MCATCFCFSTMIIPSVHAGMGVIFLFFSPYAYFFSPFTFEISLLFSFLFLVSHSISIYVYISMACSVKGDYCSRDVSCPLKAERLGLLQFSKFLLIRFHY